MAGVATLHAVQLISTLNRTPMAMATVLYTLSDLTRECVAVGLYYYRSSIGPVRWFEEHTPLVSQNSKVFSTPARCPRDSGVRHGARARAICRRGGLVDAGPLLLVYSELIAYTLYGIQ